MKTRRNYKEEVSASNERDYVYVWLLGSYWENRSCIEPLAIVINSTVEKSGNNSLGLKIKYTMFGTMCFSVLPAYCTLYLVYFCCIVIMKYISILLQKSAILW